MNRKKIYKRISKGFGVLKKKALSAAKNYNPDDSFFQVDNSGSFSAGSDFFGGGSMGSGGSDFFGGSIGVGESSSPRKARRKSRVKIVYRTRPRRRYYYR